MNLYKVMINDAVFANCAEGVFCDDCDERALIKENRKGWVWVQARDDERMWLLCPDCAKERPAPPSKYSKRWFS